MQNVHLSKLTKKVEMDKKNKGFKKIDMTWSA